MPVTDVQGVCATSRANYCLCDNTPREQGGHAQWYAVKQSASGNLSLVRVPWVLQQQLRAPMLLPTVSKCVHVQSELLARVSAGAGQNAHLSRLFA